MPRPPRQLSRAVPSPLDTPAIERLWIEAAARLGFRVERSDHAYASTDGKGTICVGVASSLDPDDAPAQLLFHELCHALVEGRAGLALPDWGLDNETDRDLVREHASLHLHVHLAARHGLCALLAPTTVYRPYHDAIPLDRPLGGGGEAAALARRAVRTAAQLGWRPVLEDALARTRALLAHPTGLPWGDPARRCAECAWRAGRTCRQAGAPTRPDAAACARFEAELDCRACGACCREAYDVVLVAPRERVARRHPGLLRARGDELELPRVDGRCVALDADGGYTCRIYADRPRTCRDFAPGGRNCLLARRKVGLSPG